MLTDVCDNTIATEKAFIAKISESSNIGTTIVGISKDFRSETCEQLTEVRGFNYFCAVESGDLQLYLSDRFDYNFFVCTRNTVISIESDDIESIKAYGTCDQKRTYVK